MPTFFHVFVKATVSLAARFASSKAESLSATDFLQGASELAATELAAGRSNLVSFDANFACLRTVASSMFSFFTVSVITCSKRMMRSRASTSSAATDEPRILSTGVSSSSHAVPTDCSSAADASLGRTASSIREGLPNSVFLVPPFCAQ